MRGIKSGLPLGDTIRIAATESPEPVKSEFRKVVESLSLGMTLPEAVERMAQRVPITETNFFSIVIAIQGKSGGNLSEAMGNLSRVLRERKKMKGKISAMSMEAKASAAIIGAVPFLVVGALYVSSPNYVSLLWTTSHGRMISGIAICWMGDRRRDDEEDDRVRLLDGQRQCLTRSSQNSRTRIFWRSCSRRSARPRRSSPPPCPGFSPTPCRAASRRSARSASGSGRASASGCRRLRARRPLRVRPSGLVKQLVETLNLTSWLSTEKAKMQLAMAGYRGAGAEYAFLAFRLVAPIAFFLVVDRSMNS